MISSYRRAAHLKAVLSARRGLLVEQLAQGTILTNSSGLCFGALTEGILISSGHAVTVPKDRSCCWPISLNSIQANLNYQNAPIKIFLPVCHARFLLNYSYAKKSSSDSLLQRSHTIICMFFTTENKQRPLIWLCCVLGFFQSLCKKQNQTVTCKLPNIYLQECPMLHFLRGTMVSLGVDSVENWAVPLYQGQLTIISDVSKGC